MTARVIAEEGDFMSVVAGPLAVQVWRRETTPDGLDALERLHDTVRAAHPKMAFLIYVDEAAAPPSAAARTRIAEMMRRSDRTVAAALVFPGHGFKASMMRGVVTGLNLVAGYPFPYRTFATLASALGWLRAAVDLPPDLERTLASLERPTESVPPP
jgi:hypothetical protein